MSTYIASRPQTHLKPFGLGLVPSCCVSGRAGLVSAASRGSLQEGEAQDSRSNTAVQVMPSKLAAGAGRRPPPRRHKQIVKSAAQNDRYGLVERPKFLFHFDLKEQEHKFYANQLQENSSTEIFQ